MQSSSVDNFTIALGSDIVATVHSTQIYDSIANEILRSDSNLMWMRQRFMIALSDVGDKDDSLWPRRQMSAARTTVLWIARASE